MAHPEERTAAIPERGASQGESEAIPAPNSWGTLAVCGGAHLLHDGLSSLVYLLLPIWAQGFSLNLVRAAALKTTYSVFMSLFQVPVTFVAERVGERWLLTGGTALAGIGFLLLGWAGGFVSLLFVLMLAGLGSSVQHPLASSLVSGAFETGKRRAALGTYNFTGDLGKMLLPGLAALSLGRFPWSATTAGVGALCLAAALSLPLVLGKPGAARPAGTQTKVSPPPAKGGGWGFLDPAGFTVLSAIGVVDGATRGGFLVLLPFVLIGKGATVELVGLSLTLLFAGGACGKFVCGILAERFGIVRTVLLTEAATAAGILLAVGVPLKWEYLVLPLLGIALNGTSSVLYATVADLVAPERRARAFALFYTLVTGASGLAPILYGAIGDHAGIPAAGAIMAATPLLALPLCWRLRV